MSVFELCYLSDFKHYKGVNMGLLDGIASAVMGKVLGGQSGGMAQVAMDLLNQNGGLSGVLEKFNQGGLAEQAASWVGKGENLPISPEQISAVLGNGQLAEIAGKFGISPEVLSSQLAEHLPGVVDKLTPDGALPTNEGDMLSKVLGMLK
jgi:uncharacterized protein YidB (DUF937 family)